MRTLNGHNRELRRQAAASPRSRVIPAPEELNVAAAPVHAHSWQPVRGPHLRVVRQRYPSNRTGCVGISYSRARTGRHSYFVVNLGRTNRKVRIETLGRHEAWRRALKLRATHELKVRAANAAIVAARERRAA